MSDLEKEHISSDESDEDFVPDGEDNLPSEEDSDGEDESDQYKTEDPSAETNNKRRKQNKRGQKRRKVESIANDDDKEDKIEKEEPKRSADEIWAEFKSGASKTAKSDKKEQGVMVTEVCNFAGEQVKVERTLNISTLNARGRGRGRGVGGLGGLLDKIGKPKKLSVLDKSKLDWQQFIQREGIEEELSTFNKGKDGYLQKQEFLQRSDLRQFEMEKQLRDSTRKTLR